MSTLEDAEEALGKLIESGKIAQDADAVRMIAQSEDQDRFFKGGEYDESIFSNFCVMIVSQLNNADVHPHTKTKLLLVLNNCSMRRETRPLIFSAIKYIDEAMENSMREEGRMPFKPELGRMSEHMLVLLMRVQNYKIRAQEVLNFAESPSGSTQFAVQLLQAILLKQPKYEFELRVNCMTGMLGFTHPGTFFSDSGGDMCENDITDFQTKITEIYKHSKRMRVVDNVTHDIVDEMASNSPTLTQPIHAGITAMMKYITNLVEYHGNRDDNTDIYRRLLLPLMQEGAAGAIETEFIKSAVFPYMMRLVEEVAKIYGMDKTEVKVGSVNPLLVPQRPTPASVPAVVSQGLQTSFKFLSFVTYHMPAHQAQMVRFVNYHTFDMLSLPVSFIASNQHLYTSLIQMNVNIDAFSDDLPFDKAVEGTCKPETLRGQLEDIFTSLSVADLRGLQRKFIQSSKMEKDGCRVAKTKQSYTLVLEMMNTILTDKEAGRDTKLEPREEPTKAEYRLLGEVPDLSAKKISEIEGSSRPDKMPKPIVVNPHQEYEKLVEDNVPSRFRCALDGNLMKTPVRTPYGHVFDKHTITKWFEQSGQLCPITGKTLQPSDLEPDVTLSADITSWHIKEQAQTNQEDEFDVYTF
eukprot:TRINITY_DN1431_c2_g1_i1.p1 TRINITY_DN1431_c2_g1~~TRINITY_DN1431_c2_g1_i1.p1  ORF type:complete len:635 (+),score=77.65 TRINITY_DN1431_c2_g1_i1:64-1968(+)